MGNNETVITTVITLVQTVPTDFLDEHDKSESREQEYIQEVEQFMMEAIDTDNTVISVEVKKEEK